ncbi:O-unit flippase, partial [Clostridium perfringens]|nr:O-unit flippase [Clostridium perfringens]
MRLKKSILNSSIAILSYVFSFLPLFIVRKSLLDNLGGEILGLTSLYNNILGYLSIVEMGVGSAIIFSLYKPFSENNKEKISGYLKYYENIYKKVGVIIFVLGLILTPFIHIFIKDDISLSLVRLGFILFLINTAIGYMFTYKHCLLNVAQEGYKISIGITISKILISIFQIFVIVRYRNFYYYIIVQIVINLIFYIIMNSYLNRRFSDIIAIDGLIDEKEKNSLSKNIKALFNHKIGGVFVLGTDNIVVSSFISLKIVAIYNNYILITTAFSTLVGQAMNGITASIGNLLVESTKEHAYKIHRKLFFVNFWVVSFLIISLFNTISHFISLWVGSEYVLDSFTISLILINLYFQMMRGQVEQFKNASGEYYRDRYAPICEGIINLTTSILLVNLIGLPGVFLGTLISNLTVIFWVQPKIVYKYVFNKPLINYFKMYFKYLAISFIPLTLTMILTSELKQNITIEAFIINCLINIVVINVFYLIIF